jgi:hypothetical protein
MTNIYYYIKNKKNFGLQHIQKRDTRSIKNLNFNEKRYKRERKQRSPKNVRQKQPHRSPKPPKINGETLCLIFCLLRFL